jgi:FlgD Ig-like domain
MKKITYWVVILHLCIVPRLFAQQTIIEKSVPMKMGECITQQISLLFEKDVAYKVLDIEVPLDGNYTFDVVVNASAFQKENLKIILDNMKVNDEIILPKKDAWVLGSMKNAKDNKSSSIFLTKGNHQVKITFGNSEIPLIDELAINKLGSGTKSNTNKHDEYINALKAQVMPSDYLSWKKKYKAARIAPNPKGNYDHQLEIAFKYTYNESFYFTQGQVVSFNTKNSNGDPVMYFFNVTNNLVSSSASWVNDDSNSTIESLITVTIPTTGFYTLLIRAYGNINGQNYGSGTSDLWRDGALYKNSIPVAGTSFQTANPKINQNVNFFTAKMSAGSDTRLYVSGNTLSPIETQNDDYSSGGSGAFSWGLSSRIKTLWASQPLPLVQVNAYSISSIGTCDIFMNVLNGDNNLLSNFPNLKPDDAIQSAPATGNYGTPNAYNCGSWAGGITTSWFWPSIFSQWNPSATNKDFLTTFDNFYGNNPPRYSGAYTYTRTGANATNAYIALWANPNWPYEDFNPTKYTHASVTKPGNDNPHGYDWESKPGGLMRTFHVRDALSDLSTYGYGNIYLYYKYTGVNAARMSGNSKEISLEESIERGLSVMDNVEFDSEEKLKLNKSNQKVESKVVDEFNKMLNELENTPISPELEKVSSYRIIYGGSKSYKALNEWCLKQGKSIYPLLISRYSVDKPWMLLLAEDILSTQYSDVLESIKKGNLKTPNDEKGSYIVRTSEMNCMRFLKKLIASIEIPNSINSLGQNYPNEMESQTTINFEIESSSEVTINVYDDKGNLIKILIDNKNQEAGKHTITWDGKNNEGRKMPSGIYIYRLVTSKYFDSKRILIK